MSKLDDIFDQAGMDESQQLLAKLEVKILILQQWSEIVHDLRPGQPWSLTGIGKQLQDKVESL